MRLFSRTHHSPGHQAMYPAPEGFYGDRPRLCCAIREADEQCTGYPQWVQKALSKSGGDFYGCPVCWNAAC